MASVKISLPLEMKGIFHSYDTLARLFLQVNDSLFFRIQIEILTEGICEGKSWAISPAVCQILNFELRPDKEAKLGCGFESWIKICKKDRKGRCNAGNARREYIYSFIYIYNICIHNLYVYNIYLF